MAIQLPIIGAIAAGIGVKARYERAFRKAKIGVDEQVIAEIFERHEVDLANNPDLIRDLLRLQGNAGYSKERFADRVESKLRDSGCSSGQIADIKKDLLKLDPIDINLTSFAIDGTKGGIDKVKRGFSKLYDSL